MAPVVVCEISALLIIMHVTCEVVNEAEAVLCGSMLPVLSIFQDAPFKPLLQAQYNEIFRPIQKRFGPFYSTFWIIVASWILY